MEVERRNHDWTLMTPRDLDEAISELPLALVPCGSLEWHGPHLGTGSDFLRGEAICSGVAERLGGGVVLPPLYVTAPGFCNWRGSLFFTPELVKRVAAEMYRELDKCGFRYALMFLAHAGKMQEESFREPADEYMKQSEFQILVSVGSGQRPGTTLGSGHGQADESAELLAAEPKAVYLERYDPRDTKIPKYDGCDPTLYCKGLSAGLHDAVREFMAREHYQWQTDLADVVTERSARALFDGVCDNLTQEVRKRFRLES